MATSDQRAAPSGEATQRAARDDNVERPPIEQIAEDAGRIIDEAAADARSYGREVAEATARLAESFTEIWIPPRSAGEFYGHLAEALRRFVRSSAHLGAVYQKATDVATTYNMKLWFDLQRTPWMYLHLLDREKLPDVYTGLPTTYEVKSGDTLSTIAFRFYGYETEPLWRKIYDANKAAIGANPRRIRPGERLTIPK